MSDYTDELRENERFDMSRPLRPDEVEVAKTAAIPPEVFQAFNKLIAQNILNGQATVVLQDAMDEVYRMKGYLETWWFDIEESYRAAGWEVRYDRPGWDEDYKSFFVFTKR